MESVTSLIKLLHKEGLIYWSNKIGLQGIRLSDYRKKSCKDGISRHKQVENYLLKNESFEHQDKLDKMLEGYEVVAVEENIDNGYIRGRIDLIIKKDNKITVCDLKSSGKIYLDQKLQVSAYKEIYKADYVAIINLENWELINLDINTKEYFDIIRSLYIIKKQIINLNEYI